MRPELRCGILQTPNSFLGVLWPARLRLPAAWAAKFHEVLIWELMGLQGQIMYLSSGSFYGILFFSYYRFLICFDVFYPISGPGTGPIGFVSKFRAILMYLCVQNSDVVFYGHQIHFGGFFGQPSGENTFSKNAPPKKTWGNLTV